MTGGGSAGSSLRVDAGARRLPPPLLARLRRQLDRMVRAAALSEGRPLEAAFRLTTDAEIHALNRRYRATDKPTDVLAFAQREGPTAGFGARRRADAHPRQPVGPVGPVGPPGAADAEVLGDVVISVETAGRQARRRGPLGLWTEVRFLASHGLCHLLGYDHGNDADEAEMNARMAALLTEAARRGRGRAA